MISTVALSLCILASPSAAGQPRTSGTPMGHFPAEIVRFAQNDREVKNAGGVKSVREAQIDDESRIDDGQTDARAQGDLQTQSQNSGGPPVTPVPMPLPPGLESHELPQILQTIDWFVAAGGVALVLFFALRSAQPRNKATRLEVTPPRPNRFGEDSILIAVLAYLVTATVFAWLLKQASTDVALWRPLAMDTAARLAGFTACAVLANTRFDGGAYSLLLRGPQTRPTKAALLILASMFIALGVCPLILDWTVWVFRQFAPEFAPAEHPTLVRLAKTESSWIAAWFWISAGAIAPIAEEVFFRGVLQNALVNMLRSRWLAIVLASFAFGAVHIAQPQAVVPLLAMGIVLGYLYERTGSLMGPIAVHSVFNLKTLVWHHFLQG